MSTPHVCPLCHGTGTVPAGYYTQSIDGTWTTARVEPETCRICKGEGVVVSEEVTTPHG